MRKIILFTFLIVFVIFLAACTLTVATPPGTSRDPQPTEPTSEAMMEKDAMTSVALDACSLITDEDVSMTCGASSIIHQKNPVGGCDFSFSDNTITVWYKTFGSTINDARTAASSSGVEPKSVAGIGDEAITFKVSLSSEIAARKGQESFRITTGPQVCNGEEGLKALAKLAVGKL